MALGQIGVSAFDQCLDQGDHLRNMGGGARLDAGRQGVQRGDILVEQRRGAGGDGRNRLAALLGPGVDLVVDVGDVAHIDDFGIKPPQQAEQHVEHDDRTGIADMGAVINRRAADIHPDFGGVEGNEGFLAAGQGIVKRKGHGTILSSGLAAQPGLRAGAANKG